MAHMSPPGEIFRSEARVAGNAAAWPDSRRSALMQARHVTPAEGREGYGFGSNHVANDAFDDHNRRR